MTTDRLIKNADRPEYLAQLKERYTSKLLAKFPSPFMGDRETIEDGLEKMWLAISHCREHIWSVFNINYRSLDYKFAMLAAYFISSVVNTRHSTKGAA